MDDADRELLAEIEEAIGGREEFIRAIGATASAARFAADFIEDMQKLYSDICGHRYITESMRRRPALLIDNKGRDLPKPSRGMKRWPKFHAIHGGLYKPPKFSAGKEGDILSNTFKAWCRKEHAKQDSHDNA